ncbi:MAG: hydrogenase maturation nickel metallochaperone HypA [Pirellulales bacterium]
MHERSLAEDILQNVQQLMAGHGAVRPVRLKLIVGEFAGVDARLLVDATSEVLAEVGYEGVAIDIDSVPLQANCRSCDQPFAVERFRFECPRCGGRDVSIEQGESLVLESVTLESDEDGLLPDA